MDRRSFISMLVGLIPAALLANSLPKTEDNDNSLNRSDKATNPMTTAIDPSTDGLVTWAYNYTEGANIGKGVKIEMTAAQALGRDEASRYGAGSHSASR